MRPSLLAAASLAGLTRVAHATAADTLEISMVFPRPDTTYAPTPNMPIVFAVRNADRARDLHAAIQLEIHDDATRSEGQYHYIYLTNQSTTTADEIQFRYNFTTLFATENNWSMAWWLHWRSCEPDAPNPDLESTSQYSDFNYLSFRTSKGGQAPDLEAAAAAAAKSCPNGDGLAFTLPTEAKLLASPIRTYPDSPLTKCLLVKSSTTASEACLATINAAAAASISSAATAEPSPSASSVAGGGGGGKSAGAASSSSSSSAGAASSSSSSAGASETAKPADSAAASKGTMGVAGLVAVLGAVGGLMA